jgi:hypothetical protein
MESNYSSVGVGDLTIVADVAWDKSVPVPLWILSHDELSDRAVRLWGFLRAAVSEEVRLPGSSHAALASLLSVSTRSTRNAVYELRDAGAIRIVPQYQDGKQLSNIYYLWPAVPGREAQKPRENGGVEGVETTFVSNGRGGSILPPQETSNNGVSDPEPSENGGGSILPPVSNTNTLKNTGNGTAKRERQQYPDEFNDLWKVYPRKLNKGGAYKSYLATLKRGVPHGDLMASAVAYAAARKGESEQYTMHGATFFGPNERWRDFLPADKAPEFDRVAAMIYDDWDEYGYYIDPDTGEESHQNPVIGGYIRPCGPDGTFVGADGSTYALDAQGARQRADYWN